MGPRDLQSPNRPRLLPRQDQVLGRLQTQGIGKFSWKTAHLTSINYFEVFARRGRSVARQKSQNVLGGILFNSKVLEFLGQFFSTEEIPFPF